jgi:hypothetical protein
VIGLFLLQSLSNLFRAHAVIQPDRKTLTEPYNRLAKPACLRSPGVTFARRHICFVRQPRAVAANFSTDRRRTHAELFGNAGLAFFASSARLNLVTFNLSKLLIRRSHLRLNPLV